MLAAERKQGPRAVLLDPAERRSLLRGIRGGREFCVFVEPALINAPGDAVLATLTGTNATKESRVCP